MTGLGMLPHHKTPPFAVALAWMILALTSCTTRFSSAQLSSASPGRPGKTPLYQLVKGKRKNPTLPPIVQGKITSNSESLPLQISVVRVGRAMFPVDGAGAYRWEGSPGAYTFTARSLGYADVASEKIRLATGDSMRLDFQLPDGPPMLHKMPKQKK